jgi:hypothetical protein
MEPCKGLNTKTSDEHRDLVSGVTVVAGYNNVLYCN